MTCRGCGNDDGPYDGLCVECLATTPGPRRVERYEPCLPGPLNAGQVVTLPLAEISIAQGEINADAVAHYAATPDVPYDPEPWFGVSLPVVLDHPSHGLVMLDGNSRLLAAWATDQAAITVLVLPPAGAA